MTVRAKFKCEQNENGSVRLKAVTSGSPENESFFSATPYGEIVMGVVNPTAVEKFVPGCEYYVDFISASEKPEDCVLKPENK